MTMVSFEHPATSQYAKKTTEPFQPINIYNFENNTEYKRLEFTEQRSNTQENNLLYMIDWRSKKTTT